MIIFNSYLNIGNKDYNAYQSKYTVVDPLMTTNTNSQVPLSFDNNGSSGTNSGGISFNLSQPTTQFQQQQLATNEEMSVHHTSNGLGAQSPTNGHGNNTNTNTAKTPEQIAKEYHEVHFTNKLPDNLVEAESRHKAFTKFLNENQINVYDIDHELPHLNEFANSSLANIKKLRVEINDYLRKFKEKGILIPEGYANALNPIKNGEEVDLKKLQEHNMYVAANMKMLNEKEKEIEELKKQLTNKSSHERPSQNTNDFQQQQQPHKKAKMGNNSNESYSVPTKNDQLESGHLNAFFGRKVLDKQVMTNASKAFMDQIEVSSYKHVMSPVEQHRLYSMLNNSSLTHPEIETRFSGTNQKAIGYDNDTVNHYLAGK